jgi:O-antigen ligase
MNTGMSRESEFSDFEPLRRLASTQRKSQHAVEDESFSVSRRPKEQKETEDRSDPNSVVVQNGTRQPSLKLRSSQPTKSWGKILERLARGHVVTFVGLFLFTFVVFFRPYEWSPSLTWLSSSAFALALATLVVFVPIQLGLENRITYRPTEVKLVLLVLLGGLLSVPFALDRLLAWNNFIEYLKVVLIFIVLVNVLRSETRLKALLVLVLIASCVLSISALIAYKSGNLALRGERIEGAIGGLFENPNDLALHLVTMIPIAAALALQSKAWTRSIFFAICGLLSLVGLAMTFSRGGFLGIAFAGSLFAWRLVRRNKGIILIFMPVALAVFILIAPDNYGSRLSTTNDESAAARADDLKRSIYIAIRHPLLGVGMANYPLYSNTNHATHNAYTQVAAETGLASAIVYTLFLVFPLIQLRKLSRQTDSEKRRSQFFYLSVGLEASLVGYMISSFFASVAYVWYAYYLVAYAVCVRRLYETNAALGNAEEKAISGQIKGGKSKALSM